MLFQKLGDSRAGADELSPILENLARRAAALEPVSHDQALTRSLCACHGATAFTFEHVDFAYPVSSDCTKEGGVGGPSSSSLILRDFSLDIAAGERVCLFGRSGSGKSTLAKVLLKLYPLTSGRVTVDGVDLQKLTASTVRQRLYYVNQRSQLWEGTVLDNIIYSNTDVNASRVERLLETYQLTVFDSLHGGIMAQAGKSGQNLSLGMIKVVLLLRAVVKDGHGGFVFDEPLTSLDAVHRAKVLNMIQGELRGRTLLIISHDPEVQSICDRLIVLQDLNDQ